MPVNEFYESFTKDRRVLFLRFVCGAFITGILTFGWGVYSNNSTQNEMKRISTENDTLKFNDMKKDGEITLLKIQVRDLQDNQIKFDNLEDQFANPRILKDLFGNVLSINHAYYLDFMKPFGFVKKDYRNDTQFWGRDFASKIHDFEELALRENRPVTMRLNDRLPFGNKPLIDRMFTVNPIRDRYGRFFMIEISVFKNYK